MVDYGPGDEIVCIDDIGITYKKNSIYVCTEVGPAKSHRAHELFCTRCFLLMEQALCVWTTIEPQREACSCFFRKKLDFKKLCNVDETTKMKEDA